MTQIDQMIADALAQSPDTVIHQLASEVVRLRSEIADLKRGGVVVPDITDEDFESVSVLMQENGIGYHDSENDSFRRIVASTWAYAQGAFVDLSRLRTIPAGRVLGDGVVAVDAEELRALERVRMEAEYVKDAFHQMGEFSQMEGIMRALHELDALRANQGGANHD